ncbi:MULTISPECIES: CHAT domain-containing protein [Caldilinea]|jgi:CHAT domain-containing protein|uniref:CHAT domain-containing protein n=1 Tax=Caldilinea aerophila (strain DSM 14535 / JCM 11387 / NBRC 104270 / STL-6-O1) TaxID=926550 RepID=I0I7Y1_CALAS|nr:MULTISPECIES: CHAT domain-containing protein [Caldilinea]BAM01369.1 hypothetical protein CLDAP_33290 [Caldilinea aerophila DSM 14535 = NBRC 104270]GIV72709.1 MAG: hypothetical protein KatS3mg049_1265 [Caldilinea sp.]
MNRADIPELLHAYCRLVSDEVGDWAQWIAQFARVLERLQHPPAGDLSAVAQGLPFAPLLIALGHYVDGRDPDAVTVLQQAYDAFVDTRALVTEVTATITEASVAALRARSRAGALAVFLAACGAHEEALWLFSRLEGARRPRSPWETELLARSLLNVRQLPGALQVAWEGIQDQLWRRNRLDSGALRLNFGGSVGFSLTRLAAAAVWAEADDDANVWRGLHLCELGRDPLLAEIVHTINRAPFPILARMPVIRPCWAAEAAAFQWRDLLARVLIEHGPGSMAEAVEQQYHAAESATKAAKTNLRQTAPSLYSMFFAPGRALLRSPVAPGVIEESQKSLTPGTAVLGYEVLEDQVYAWALTHDRLTMQCLAISPSELAEHVAAVYESCRAGALAAEPRLAPLSEALLHWAEGILEVNERLLIVSSGALRALPFAVLPWHGQPLLASHTCSILPTLSLLPDLGSHKSVDYRNATVAAFGDPSGARWTSPTGAVVAPPRLQHAAREAQEVVRIAGERGQPAVCGPDATRDAVVAALQATDIVHLAMHARFCQEAPLFSAFLLANGEQLTVVDLIGINSRADLIVASACSTGESNSTSGDDVLGISRGLLACGARVAVVSLWPVDDEHTADLMIAFYRALFDGLDPARALREAQLTFLYGGPLAPARAREVPSEKVSASSGTGTERFWAPFIVVGV